MAYYILKVVISALIIVAVSEISRRNAVLAGLLASLPLISLLAFIWLWVETHDPQRIIALSMSIFWLVLPSLTLFLVLVAMLKRGIHFGISLPASVVAMLAAYGLMLLILHRFGIQV